MFEALNDSVLHYPKGKDNLSLTYDRVIYSIQASR